MKVVRLLRDAPRPVVLLRMFLVVLPAAVMIACGGGGGGDDEPSGPPPEAGDNLVASIIQTRTQPSGTSGSYQHTLYVFDPEAPATPVQAIDLGAVVNPVQQIIQYSDSYSVDAATDTSTYNGRPLVFYVNDGKVYKIDLRRGKSHEPVRVSSATTACELYFNPASWGGPLPVSADGMDYWLGVKTLNEGTCVGGELIFVRSTMSASTAPVTLPENVQLIDVLHDAGAGVVAYLAREAAGLALYNTKLARVAGVGGSAPPSARRIGNDYTHPNAAYYMSGGTLQRMTWNAAGTSATFEPATYTFHGPNASSQDGLSDRTAFYFADDRDLLAVSGDGVPRLVTTTATRIVYLLLAGDSLAVQEVNQASTPANASVSVVAKSGGASLTISATGQFGAMRGASSSHVFYNIGADLHAYALNGSGDTVINAGVRSSIGTYSFAKARSRVGDDFPIASIAYCVPTLGTDEGCNIGQLTAVNGSTLDRSVLGQVSHAAVNSQAALLLSGPTINLNTAVGVVAGIPQLASFGRTYTSGTTTISTSDLYLYTPGTAGSFVRLTNNLP